MNAPSGNLRMAAFRKPHFQIVRESFAILSFVSVWQTGMARQGMTGALHLNFALHWLSFAVVRLQSENMCGTCKKKVSATFLRTATMDAMKLEIICFLLARSGGHIWHMGFQCLPDLLNSVLGLAFYSFGPFFLRFCVAVALHVETKTNALQKTANL